MKFAILLLVVASAMLVQESDAHFGGFGMRRWGMGMGLGRFGGMGMGFGRFGGMGLGFGGIGGFGGFGGFGPMGGMGAFGPLGGLGGAVLVPIGIGKRSAEFENMNPTEEWLKSENRTACYYASEEATIICQGLFSLNCTEIKQIFNGLESFEEVRGWGLSVVPEITKGVVDKYQLVTKRPKSLFKALKVDFTSEKLPFFFFNSESIKENGLLIKDEKCWNSFTEMINKSGEQKVMFALLLKNIVKA